MAISPRLATRTFENMSARPYPAKLGFRRLTG